jgi:hypothetical protein
MFKSDAVVGCFQHNRFLFISPESAKPALTGDDMTPVTSGLYALQRAYYIHEIPEPTIGSPR